MAVMNTIDLVLTLISDKADHLWGIF